MILEQGMQNYPVVVMDNFYNNVDKIREFALSQEYFEAEGNVHPGKRTKPLHDIDKEFSTFCVNKFLNLFYDLDHNYVSWNCQTRFQLIEPYHEDEDSWLNKGFIHTDGNCAVAGLVYLNPECNLNSGTSIYKPVTTLNNIDTDNIVRKDFYSGKDVSEQYVKQLQNQHSKFVETVNVKNVYNRIIAYDANIFHASTSVHSGKEPRLTQVFFIHNIQTTLRPPVVRVRKYPE